MYNLFSSLLTLIRFETVSVDNIVFQMHYKFTTILLLVFSIIVGSKEHFGEPIRCNIHGTTASSDFINMYCWIRPSFTVDKLQGDETISQGVGPFVEGEDTVTHMYYYQWVELVLFIEAFVFYVPHLLWRCWEGGRIKMLCTDMGNPVLEPKWNKERQRMLAQYLSKQNTAMHNIYAAQFAFSEALNFLNVVGQLFFLDNFLNGEFIHYGISLLNYSPVNGTTSLDPREKLFPKITKCAFRKFGPTGDSQYLDALCVLPLNALNEKVFAIIWFWFICLISISAMAIVYRFTLIMSPYFRSILIMANTRQIPLSQAVQLSESLSYGTWFMLYQLSKNLNAAVFREVLSDLYSNSCSNTLKLKTKQGQVSEP